MRNLTALAAVAGLLLAACSDADPVGPRPADNGPSFSAQAATPGSIYVLSNSASANQVLAFERAADGSVGPMTAWSTGGTGTGGGLGSQGALAQSGRWLLAVNAGSDEVSVFRVGSGGLQLVDRVASGGDMPISVTVDGGLAYVLNAGGAGNITGFRLSPQGSLSPIAGSTQPLSGAGVGPAQVQFSPDGAMLVVTEKATNLITTYTVDAEGRASPPTSFPSSGATPFGFAFAGPRTIVVSEAFGGAPDASATSSYRLGAGTLTTVSGSVATTETAACWTVLTKNRRYAYVTNTGSGSVTGYAVAEDGSLSLLDGDGVTGVTGAGSSPIDAAVTNSGFMYVLNAGAHTISAFRVRADGSLEPLAGAAGLPTGAVGLAAR
jgi:6-phosphogluconolactonase (cycloisomerase 2 family)